MAKATTTGGAKNSGRSSSGRNSTAGSTSRKKSTAVATSSSSRGSGSGGSSSADNMGEAFIKLLQSPLVADLLAVAATAALAALAEHGFSSRGAGDSRRRDRAGKAVKEAGKAAAAAIGRRLSNELEEIRAASKKTKGAAEA